MMGRIGCGDDDQVDGPGEQLIDAADEGDICIARVRRAMTLDDGGKAETLDRANDGRVKYLACEAVTDESDVEHRAAGSRGFPHPAPTPCTSRPISSRKPLPPASIPDRRSTRVSTSRSRALVIPTYSSRRASWISACRCSVASRYPGIW